MFVLSKQSIEYQLVECDRSSIAGDVADTAT